MRIIAPSLAALTILSIQGIAPASAAQTPQPEKPSPASPELSNEARGYVARAADWLQALGPSQGRFTQTDARGVTTQGKVYIRRPGRIRFEYDPPSGLLVVSDGYNVKVRDSRLNTFNQYPLGATPLQVLLAKEVRMDRGVRIERAEATVGGFQIVARDQRRPQDGSLTLVFSDVPLRLQEWTVSDAQGRRTRLQLDGLAPASGLKDELFKLKPPTPKSGRP